MKKIFEYDDYRVFLKEVFEFKKEKTFFFSYQYCANKLNTSKSYIKLIIDRKRHMSLDKVNAVAVLFDIPEEDRRFFLLLFLYNTAQDKVLRESFFDILTKMRYLRKRDQDFSSQVVEDDKENLFNDWLKMAIHPLVKLSDFQEKPSWILDKLNNPAEITETQVLNTIEIMIEEGLFERKEGRLEVCDFVSSAPTAFDDNFFSIFKVGLFRAIDLIDNIEEHKPRNFNMLTLALNDEDIEKLHNKFFEIRDFAKQLSEKSSDQKHVILVNTHFVSLTK